jgi:hypothetical protein
VKNEEFSVPSLLREVREWSDPSLLETALPLLDDVGVGGARDRLDGFGEHLARLLEVLEPTLILLSVGGYSVSRLVVAGTGSQVAVRLPFNADMRATAWPRTAPDWPTVIEDELDTANAVVGLEVSPLFAGVPLTRLRDGWFLIPIAETAHSLDLADVLSALAAPLDDAESELQSDLSAVVGGADLAALGADPQLNSGHVTMFDPAGWSFGTAPSDDPDVLALEELGNATLLLIDSDPVADFLADEVERARETRVPLRDRFRTSRDERQLLRRGMRGARRRHRDLDPDGIHRAFRYGRSRRLTYTEFLMGCHLEGVVDVLDRIRNRDDLAPEWSFVGDVLGQPGQRYLIARLAPPFETMQTFELALLNPPAEPNRLEIGVRRWGLLHGVAGDVQPTQLALVDGRLPLPLLVVDGPQDTPTIEVKRYGLDGTPNPTDEFMTIDVLQISGIQHGDVLVFTDTASETTADVAVVKNFSRNDLSRLNNAGYALGLAPPFNDPGSLSETLIDTIAFVLADGPGTSQELQRSSLAGTVTGPFPSTDTPRADPGTLDIPSARGIGMVPDDSSHFHPCAPALTAQLANLVTALKTGAATAANGIPIPANPVHATESYRVDVTAHHSAMHDPLDRLIDDFAETSGATTIWHTYEAPPATLGPYLLPGNTLQLWPGDPIRNIRTDRDRAPRLFPVSALDEASAGFAEQSLETLDLQVGLFVNRRAEIVLYLEPSRLTDYGATLQVADALASLLDGGQEPANLFVPDEEDPVPPPPPPPPPGCVNIQVVDDEGDPLPRAIVTITGPTVQQAIKTGLDGTLELTNQEAGDYQAYVTDYPSHGPGLVDFELPVHEGVNVDLVLGRTPAPSGRPPMRGAISEASGFNLREAPGGDQQVLGKLHYTPYEVTVLEAREIPKDGPPVADLWYRVRFAPQDFERVVTEHEAVLIAGELDPATETEPSGLEKIALHTAAIAAHQGVELWVGQAAMAMIAMPWDHFLGLLADFELQFAGDGVLSRLSRLRQMAEEPDVPGNDVVGYGHHIQPQINISDRVPDPDRWSLLLETKQVALPDGEVLDIHHFLLGVDALIDDGRRGENRVVYHWLDALHQAPLRIGESYSSVTWSGDLGGAVAEMVRHSAAEWEAATVRQPDEILDFYFRTKAPDFDLLGDIDAWGAFTLMPHRDGRVVDRPPARSLTDLVTWVYGPAGPLTPEHVASRALYREKGVRQLLYHYGFTDASALIMQVVAVDNMQAQVDIFAPTWFLVQAVKALMGFDHTEGWPWPNNAEEAAMDLTGAEMLPLFLEWLQNLAEQFEIRDPLEPF